MNSRFWVYALTVAGGLGALSDRALGWVFFYTGTTYDEYSSGHPTQFGAVETFEESTLGPSMTAALPLALLQNGVANGPFPSGMTAGLPMHMEANQNGTSGSTRDARLTAGALATASALLGAYQSDVALTNVTLDSFDLVFTDNGPVTVSVGLDLIASLFGTPVHIRLFDSLGAEVFGPAGWDTGVGGPGGSLFRGVAGQTPSERIGRINISTTSIARVGADNIRAQWVLPCGSADFNCDGDIGTDADIEAFFACLGGACPPPPCPSNADFNGDGDIGTDSDIEAFFRVLAGGAC
jgi:hypothetical protein